MEVNICLYFLHTSRHALDIREHYERKLERANNLYMELSAIMLQLEVREKELMKYVNKLYITVSSAGFTVILPLSSIIRPYWLSVYSSSKAFPANEIFEIMTMAWQNN